MDGLFEKIIVVDSGKSEVKVLVYTNEFELTSVFSFPSLSDEVYTFRNVDELQASNKQFRVEYNGKKYLIGQGAENLSVDTQKVNTHHQLCIYSAISAVITKPNENVCVLVGCPSTDYDNESTLSEYRTLIFGKSNGNISINVNGENKSFTFVSLSVYPEGLSMKYRQKFRRQAVNVVDIGGQNVNFRHYDDHGISKGKSFSLDSSGINLLEEYIDIEIRKNLPRGSIDPSLINIKKAIKNGFIEEVSSLNGFASTADFINISVLTFIHSEIFTNIIKRSRIQITSPGHVILFTGGGSILLKKYLLTYFDNNKEYIHFIDVAKWDNCISFIMKYISDLYRNEKDKAERQNGINYAKKIIAESSIERINELVNNRE